MRFPLRRAMTVLALLGVALATYLTIVHYAGLKPACTAGQACVKVQTSQWSELAGVPVALIGLIGYIVILGALLAPHGLMMVNGNIYFTAEGSKAIGRYNPASRQIDWVLGLGQNRTHMLVVAKDESQIFTSNVNSNTISILDREKSGDVSGWIQTTIPVGKGPEGFDVSPDDKEIWAANSHDGTVSIIDLASRKVVQTIDIHTKMANRLEFAPDGKLVLVSDLRSGDLVVVDAAARKEVRRVNLGRGVAGVLIVPDGSRAYVAVSPDNKVAVFDLKTLSVVGSIPTGNGPDGMAWVAGK